LQKLLLNTSAGNKAAPSCVDPGTPASDRSVESAGFQMRPNCAPVETVGAAAELPPPTPLVMEPGELVPQPENEQACEQQASGAHDSTKMH